MSVLAKETADVLLASASQSLRLHLQQVQNNTLELSLCTSAIDDSTCQQHAEVVFAIIFILEHLSSTIKLNYKTWK
jgi:hypothetical protein